METNEVVVVCYSSTLTTTTALGLDCDGYREAGNSGLIDKNLAVQPSALSLSIRPASFQLSQTLTSSLNHILSSKSFTMVGFGFKATTSKPLASRAAPSKPKPSLFANDSDDEGDISNGAKGEDIGEFGEIDMPRSKTKKSLAKINPIKAPSAPPKHKPVRMADNSDDENENEKDKASDGEAILEFGGINVPVQTTDTDLRTTKKSSSNPLTEPPSRGPKSKAGANSYGDLSSALTSKKNAETAEALDANIYDYDAVYDSMKPKKHVTVEDEDRKPKYMKSLLEAAALRKRDQIIGFLFLLLEF